MKPEVCPTSGRPCVGKARGVPHLPPCAGYRMLHINEARQACDGPLEWVDLVPKHQLTQSPTQPLPPYRHPRRACPELMIPCPARPNKLSSETRNDIREGLYNPGRGPKNPTPHRPALLFLAWLSDMGRSTRGEDVLALTPAREHASVPLTRIRGALIPGGC